MSRSSGGRSSAARASGGRSTKTPGGKRGRGRAFGVVATLLALFVVAGLGLAAYLGFIPGLPLGGRSDGALAADSSLAATTGARPDSAPASTPTDSAAAASLEGATAGAGTVSPADSAAGDAIYHGAGRCVACHGAAGGGVAGLGPALRDSARHVGDGSLASIARIVGGGAPPSDRFRIAMPAYGGQLTPDDVARVAAYVYAVGAPGRTAADSANGVGLAPKIPPPGETVNADAPATAPGATLAAPSAASPTTGSAPAGQATPPVRHPTVPPPPAPAPRRP